MIAGMGGPLMIRILEEGKKTAESLKYLILSPQSELPKVRRYLADNQEIWCATCLEIADYHRRMLEDEAHA